MLCVKFTLCLLATAPMDMNETDVENEGTGTAADDLPMMSLVFPDIPSSTREHLVSSCHCLSHIHTCGLYLTTV